ncbi:MAG: hypothetical protein AAF483_11005 [Planctomycetota bacterium]
MQYRIPLLTLALLVVSTVGCGGSNKGPRTVPASGIITLDGQPVHDAAIVFTDAKGEYFAHARSDEEGKFSLNAFEYKTGAVPGEYMVAIQRTVVNESQFDEEPEEEGSAEEPPEEESEHEGDDEGGAVRNDLPAKYATPSEDFMFTIPEDGTDSLKLELVSD